jgi:hypothetical protein
MTLVFDQSSQLPFYQELINEENEAEERNYWKKDEIKRFLAIT